MKGKCKASFHVARASSTLAHQLVQAFGITLNWPIVLLRALQGQHTYRSVYTYSCSLEDAKKYTAQQFRLPEKPS